MYNSIESIQLFLINNSFTELNVLTKVALNTVLLFLTFLPLNKPQQRGAKRHRTDWRDGTHVDISEIEKWYVWLCYKASTCRITIFNTKLCYFISLWYYFHLLSLNNYSIFSDIKNRQVEVVYELWSNCNMATRWRQIYRQIYKQKSSPSWLHCTQFPTPPSTKTNFLLYGLRWFCNVF